jgi:hypothetical protein
MKQRSYFLSSLFLFFIQVCFSQNQHKIWYFGTNAGLDFVSSPPAILTNGALVSYEPCGSISDAAGNLLFYTNGITVWNKQHVVMANGTGLMGDASAGQSAMIVKQPGNANLYYIFTLDDVAGPNGLRYSVVDMSLAAGNGSLTVKNTLLVTPSTEKLTAAWHCNNTDIWIISHDWNSNNFRSYLLNSSGISLSPVLSPIGSMHTLQGGQTYPAVGCMKSSPNGKKLAVAIYYNPNSFELYDFDQSTGVVSNSLSLGNGTYAYGCEFSPDGTRLYGTTTDFGSSTLFQWDLCAGSPAAVVASMVTINTPSVLGQLQRASDGKIYIGNVETPQSSMLCVINNPNVAGAGCNFMSLGQSVAPNTTQSGLPNLPLMRTDLPPFTYTGPCSSHTFELPPAVSAAPTVCAAAAFSLAGVNWDFGDPLSGAANVSVQNNPVHLFTSAGTYTVQLTINYSCGGGTDIITRVVQVSACTGLPGTSGGDSFLNIYPNPGKEELMIEVPADIQLFIYNDLGQLVSEQAFLKGTHSISIASLSKGVYVLKAISGTGIRTSKFFKAD